MSYVSLHKSQLLDSIENQVLFADLVNVIIGQKGLGKTFLLDQLHDRLSGQVYLSQIIADAVLTLPQLKSSVELQFEFGSQESKLSLLEKCQQQNEQRYLITIDDAHLLSQPCLDYLLSLVAQQLAAKHTVLFIVLTGEASLARKLSETSVFKDNPNICVVLELKTIEQSETKNLIAEFQSLDVGTAEALYDEQKLSYFWQLSNGVPGDLKADLERWLEQSEVKLTPKPEAKPNRQYLMSIGYIVLAIVLLTILIYQDEINELIVATPPSNQMKQQSALDSNKPSETGTDIDKPLVVSDRIIAKRKIVITAENPQNNTSSNSSVENKQTTVKPADPSEQTQIATPVESTNNYKNIPEIISDKTQSANAESAPQVKKKVAERVIKASNNDIDEKKLEPAIESARNSTGYSAFSKLTTEEQQLMQLDSKLFTLQWLGVSSMQSAENFRQQHALKNDLVIYRRKQKNSYLYLVVGGEFSSHLEANKARAAYAKQGYAGNPWIKSVEAVQKEIAQLD